MNAHPLRLRVDPPRHYSRSATITALVILIAVVGMIATRTTGDLSAISAQSIKAQSWWLTQSGASAPPSHAGPPTDGQGIYESCNPAEAACLAHLDVLAQGGFQLVINYSQFAPNATLADELAYAAHAQQVGIRVIWPMSAFIYRSNAETTLLTDFPALNQSLIVSKQCPWYSGTNYTFATCLTQILRDASGTWGYYIGDELPVSREPDLRHLVDAITDVDPGHPRLFVAGSASATANRVSLTTFGRSYCDGYECHPDATVIAQDFYPIGAEPQNAAATLTGHVAEGVATLAAQEGASYGIVLQSHSLAHYPDLYACPTVEACPYPTQQQMLAMRDAVFAHPTPRLVLWYSYFDLLRSDNPTQHWADLIAAVNQGR